MGDLYACNTYSTYGKTNPAGCRVHVVKAKVVDPLVSEYLDRAGASARALLGADDARELLANLEREVGDKKAELLATHKAVQDFLAPSPAGRTLNDLEPTASGFRLRSDSPFAQAFAEFSDRPLIQDEEETAAVLLRVYEIFYGKTRDNLTLQIAEQERQYDRLYEKFKLIDPANRRAVQRMNQEMAALEAEIDRLKATLQPLTEQVARIRSELGRLVEAIDAAKVALQGRDERVKAEAARKVIARIECHFEHRDKGRNRSPLVRVDIIPLVGARQGCFPDGAPGRTCGGRRRGRRGPARRRAGS
jgi:hypothetical protein